jgi:hypothetical protein
LQSAGEIVGVGGIGEGLKVGTAEGTVIAAGGAALQLCSINNSATRRSSRHHHRGMPEMVFIAHFPLYVLKKMGWRPLFSPEVIPIAPFHGTGRKSQWALEPHDLRHVPHSKNTERDFGGGDRPVASTEQLH